MVNIEENKVPLVQSMTSYYDNWLMVTGIMIIVITMVYILGSYIQLCIGKRRKLKELSEFYGVTCYSGWNIFRLRREIQRLEWGTMGL